MQCVGTWFSAGLVVGLDLRVFSEDENAIHDLETNLKALSDQLAISNCLQYFLFMIAVKRESRGIVMICSMCGSSVLLCFSETCTWN